MSIEIKDLSVQFRNGTVAINHINMNISKGIYGLLGENGAGKTTLMRVLTTILRPTGGQVKLSGIELNEENYEKLQSRIGYLPQELGLYSNLSVRESLEYMGGLAGVSKEECKKRIDFYLERTGLTDHQKKKNRQLSGGMKRRVGLVQALLHNPEILIVDEPTTGLDPEERIRIRNLLVDFSKDRIVLFSTHILEDLAATCNNLGILKKGNLIYDGKREALLHQVKDSVWICKLRNEEEYNLIQNRYLISAKNYTEDGIETRIIADKKPHVPGINVNATLEDAYIYLMNRDPE
ncbi:MAG TPA: ABC transporter ATP-binding protein [Lachnospiraceae bacterium]|jgi:ABC-type multidrug transport system ATPase subunit|nr:ABC transporter ATP-binding protein [Lachnospiraceae bacterium]